MTEQEQQEMAQDYAEAAQVVSFHGKSVCCTVCMEKGRFDSLLVIDSVDPDEVNGSYSLSLHCVFCSTVFQAEFELYEEVEQQSYDLLDSTSMGGGYAQSDYDE